MKLALAFCLLLSFVQNSKCGGPPKLKKQDSPSDLKILVTKNFIKMIIEDIKNQNPHPTVDKLLRRIKKFDSSQSSIIFICQKIRDYSTYKSEELSSYE